MVGTSESGNPNPSPSTRFGGEKANPRHQDNALLNKPWAIRNAQRYFLAQSVDVDDVIGKSEDEILKKLIPNPRKTTLAQIGAARQTIRFGKNCEDAQQLADNTEGKLAQPTLNAELADIINRPEDQLNEIIQRFTNTGQNHAADGGSSGDRATEEAGGEETAG